MLFKERDLAQPASRREFLRRGFTITAAAAGLVAVTRAHPAEASADWCWDDPVVNIGGKLVTVMTGVYGDPTVVKQNVRSATVLFFVPLNVSFSVVSTTFNYFQEIVAVERRGNWSPGQSIKMNVTVTFDALADLPARVYIQHPGGTTTPSGSTTKGQISQMFSFKP